MKFVFCSKTSEEKYSHVQFQEPKQISVSVITLFLRRYTAYLITYVVMNLTEYYTTQGVKKYIWQLFSIVISLILLKSAEMRGGCED